MGKNPEQIQMKNGGMMTKFRVSVRKDRRVRDGEQKYNYFDCVAFDKVGDYIYKYANSQSKVSVEGSMENTSWMGKDGIKRYGNQISVTKVDIITSTVNQGDFQQQPDPLEQYQQDGFKEVDASDLPDLPFL